jgi:hypothetical protein
MTVDTKIYTAVYRLAEALECTPDDITGFGSGWDLSLYGKLS